MGVRRARWDPGRDVHLGRRTRGSRTAAGQLLARTLPVASGGRLRRDNGGRLVSSQRLRPVRHGRQRLGADAGLVCSAPLVRLAGLLHAARPTRGNRGGQLRPRTAAVSAAPQGRQGRFVPVRGQLLSALPARGATTADGRLRDEPHRVPVCGRRLTRRRPHSTGRASRDAAPPVDVGDARDIAAVLRRAGGDASGDRGCRGGHVAARVSSRGQLKALSSPTVSETAPDHPWGVVTPEPVRGTFSARPVTAARGLAMDAYPPIEDHGLVGDLQTAALVTKDGSVDWFCCPRFDSPSVFGSLLDSGRGGRFRISPTTTSYHSRQLYFPDSAILITRFMSEDGVGEVVDFMPVTGAQPTDNHRLVRMVRCVRGEMSFEIEVSPRFDYGRLAHESTVTDNGAVFRADGVTLTMHAIRNSGDEHLARFANGQGRDVRGTLSLRAGQTRGVVLESAADGPPREISVAEAEALLEQTGAFWRGWLAQSTYTGRWRETLQRSAITLKLMTYAPTGGIVAAPTAGLPEQVGGERNWDYRYTWVRDGSFSVYALLGMGFTEEAAAFCGWLRDRVQEKVGGDGGPLNIMYRVDGASDLKEESLDHWEGYRGSSPVRIGNGAMDQVQMDIYGEALDSMYFADQHGIELDHKSWLALRDVVDWLVDNWDQKGAGIWETRGGAQDFTYGRLMSWGAFDRALRLATRRGRPAATGAWTGQRDAIYDQIMDRGWSAGRGAFVQHYGAEVLDSSLLRMATVGFISPNDPMWASTLDAMDDELVTDSLVYRYDPSASPDGLRGSEGTFSLCTFNYVDALANAGRLDDARLTFEKMLTYANHLGLYSEEIGSSGEQLGNFPQAFTHLALIDAAITLDEALTRQKQLSGGIQVPVSFAGAAGAAM